LKWVYNILQMINSTKIILLLAFFEGVTVMMIELLGGKMLVPYFGNSLIVWTSTIGVTMTSLMLGYFAGGYLAKQKNNLTILFFLLSITCVWVVLMPKLSNQFISSFAEANLYTAATFSALSLLGLPLILLGACPPILIEQLAQKNKAGISSGKIFAISTFGSISCALILGFLIIGKYGIAKPTYFYGCFLFIFSVIILWKVAFTDKIYFALMALPIIFSVLLVTRSSYPENTLYISEGLQGQLKVYDEKEQIGVTRNLQINGVSQTKQFIYLEQPDINFSRWWYVHFEAALSTTKPSGSNALLMGFGGGSMARELTNLGFNLDVVEIDGRLVEIAKNFFFFNTTNVKFYIDDARHFIKKNKSSKYDLIILDILIGEVQPSHVFTKEGLLELKELMEDDAIVILNYVSNYDEPQKPVLSLLNTFKSAGYDVKLFDGEDGRPSDYIFLASKTKLSENYFNENRLSEAARNNPKVMGLVRNPKFISIEDYPNTPVITLTDNHPLLETMNKQTLLYWRENMINEMQKSNLSIYK
jgi:hypothetical protein